MIVTAPDAMDEDLAVCAGRRGRDAGAAFEVLVRRYGVRLLGFLRTCGVPDGRREDVAQDAWLRAWRALPAWRPAHFRAWLFQVARNAAEDARRTERRRSARNDPDGAVISLLPSLDEPPDHNAEIQDDVRKLTECLKRLTEDQRAMFNGYAGGERYEELSARLGIPIGSVKSRLSRAREALQKCLGVSAP